MSKELLCPERDSKFAELMSLSELEDGCSPSPSGAIDRAENRPKLKRGGFNMFTPSGPTRASRMLLVLTWACLGLGHISSSKPDSLPWHLGLQEVVQRPLWHT